MSTLILSILLILTAYSLFSISNILGFLMNRNQKVKTSKNFKQHPFSIILPVRNEAKNIEYWLNSLNQIVYAPNNAEIIIVDDNSDDETTLIIEKLKSSIKFDISVYKLVGNSGKKAALDYGIKNTKYDLIITTDADCTYHKEWLNTISEFYSATKPDMVIAPVTLKSKNTFERLQSLEFMSLMGSGLSFASLKMPFLNNGANLMYKKAIYLELDGFLDDKNLVSGDDVLLLTKFKKNKKKILPLINKKAIVYTNACKSLNEFINQRIRWASKTKYSKSIILLLIGLVVSIMNISLILFGLLSFFFNDLVEFFLLQVCIKFVFDFLFLFLIAFFLKRKRLLVLFPLVFIMYPIYNLIILMKSIKGEFEWKERKYNEQ